MEKAQFDFIYLTACGVNGICPERAVLEDVNVTDMYRISCHHFLDALVGETLRRAGVSIPKEWTERIGKAVRKVILFDMERAKLFAFMEQKGIWYLPLKGIVLKDYYPSAGMRQMSDNDILFDSGFCSEVQAYMESEGYKAVSTGWGNHDIYEKEPVFNFELHRSLYSERHPEGWEAYYEHVKDRLVLQEGTSCGYHFTDEDFYVYLVSHAYKHYSESGTGLRTLLDFYVYLNAKAQELDFARIEKECDVLGIAAFEKQNRSLCRKVFDPALLDGRESLEEQLSAEEMQMLSCYLTSGVYGTHRRGVENRMRKFQTKSGSKSKVRYLLSRLFPDMETYRLNFPFFYRHKWLLPVGWLYRMVRMVFSKSRRANIAQEIQIIKKAK